MQQTSLLAYKGLKDEQKLGERQRLVFDALRKLKEATDCEIAHFMGFKDMNAERPRRNELVRYGLVREKYKRKDYITGKMAIVWEVAK